MGPGLYYHLITILAVLAFKLSVLYVGYLLSKLGYDLLIKGISGEFKFNADIKGAKADLASVSPGVFFVFLGSVLVATAILKDKPMQTVVNPSWFEQIESNADVDEKPELPDTVPTLEELSR